jgi:hypothetical protein
MKNYIKEVVEPLVDFYKIRKTKKNEIIFFAVIPLLIGVIFLFSCFYLSTSRKLDLVDFDNDLLNQLITMLTLFISFSMAFLSILLSSSSKNVDDLKDTSSKEYSLNNKNCSLYQVLMIEITYSMIIEICFLLYVFLQKFVIYVSNDITIKFMLTLDIILLVHVLLLMLVTIKNVYYTFWKSK